MGHSLPILAKSRTTASHNGTFLWADNIERIWKVIQNSSFFHLIGGKNN
jgi:hypothetical protein